MTQLDLFESPKRKRDLAGERQLMRVLRSSIKPPEVAGMSRRQIKLLMRGLPPITVPR